MTKLAPEWVRTSDPVIRSPACYRWTTAPAVPLIEDRWLNPAMKLGRLKAKTILNYLFSLDFFFNPITWGGVPRLSAATKNWRKAMKKSVAIDNNKLQIKQREEIVTPDVVIRYETSERAREAIKIFDFLQETPDCSISTYQFAHMRAYPSR